MESLYLIQSGSIWRPLVSGPFNNAVELGIMGAIEFSGKRLIEAGDRLYASARKLSFVKFAGICDVNGNALYGYGDFRAVNPSEYASKLREVIEGKYQTKRGICLPLATRSDKFPGYKKWTGRGSNECDRYLPSFDNFWWDIKNDVMLSFDSEFMEGLPNVLVQSWVASGHRPVKLKNALKNAMEVR